MGIDLRTRRYSDIADGTVGFVDDLVSTALADHGDLAGRGARVMGVPSLGFDVVDAEAFTLVVGDGALHRRQGLDAAALTARLDVAALGRLLQDVQSTMGLTMTSDVRLSERGLDDWVRWEPVLRALVDGRAVHEPGDIDLGDVDLSRTFTLADDRDEMRHFLETAGFLHVSDVFDPSEMELIGIDLDDALGRAGPDDGASWWGTGADGTDMPVRVLWFNEQSAQLSRLLADDRLTWLCALTGDGHEPPRKAEGLVKPLDIVRGLSDLPWHKDCGQGHHSYFCCAMTVGISVTGADADSGALGVVPGSHRANTLSAMLDPGLDLEPIKLETATGDLTVHCSDTLHRAHPPKVRPRKVVYTAFGLPSLPGDDPPAAPNSPTRAARADLSSVTDRIEAADGTSRVAK